MRKQWGILKVPGVEPVMIVSNQAGVLSPIPGRERGSTHQYQGLRGCKIIRNARKTDPGIQ